MNLQELVLAKKVVICCGSGGVGKTTTSAALALSAAAAGKNAVVITIDPAKRLATSLGIKVSGAKPTDITAHVNEILASEGKPSLKGRLHALMPESEETFEQFIRSMAGTNEGAAKKILKTSIYKIFAQEFSGTNEYLAMEKLHDLYSSGLYDVIVLDTPPSSNTMAFLDAPEKLLQFFDDRIVRFFVEPGSKLIAAGLRAALEILERLTGKGFIAELLEFTSGLFELRTQFVANLRTVMALLKQDDVSFLMVTTPERLLKDDTQGFVNRLKRDGHPFWGFVINRTLAPTLGLSPGEVPDPVKLAESVSDPEAREILVANFKELLPRLQHEKRAVDFLARLGGEHAYIAEQRADVHSVKALTQLL